MRRSPMTRLAIALTVVTVASATAAHAQATPRAFVRVTARDSSGAPIPSAELTITRGLRDVVARGSTDDAGTALLSVSVKDSTDLQVTMRKIGYVRGDRFFALAQRDTARVTVTVARPSATALAPVQVTAQSNPQWTSYHLGADDIQNSDLPFENGWDVVKRLRPDMLTSRGGCNTGVQEVWVNGRRIRLTLLPSPMVAARARVGAPIRARFGYVPLTVMSEIAPEHIQELIYHDCFSPAVAGVGSINALFVVLKPGVAYQQDVGSYVVDAEDKSK